MLYLMLSFCALFDVEFLCFIWCRVLVLYLMLSVCALFNVEF